ncbi:zinc finger MYM-type protein 1-like [Corticium candelabrum]|uniref:zinc finger MYM-type protein 1-like n=1 Tax=Corticium candelabrum TaxID=121492 RepID=UPI002E2753F1|nr:zinc finger MYM-type protein 1-like [Corticium candelabrum]
MSAGDSCHSSSSVSLSSDKNTKRKGQKLLTTFLRSRTSLQPESSHSKSLSSFCTSRFDDTASSIVTVTVSTSTTASESGPKDSVCHAFDPCRGPTACSVTNGPYQPCAKELPHGKFPQTKSGICNRSFQPHWYTQFCWLEYSPAADSAFCFPCRLTVKHNLDKQGCPDQAFVSRGFRKWKSAVADMRRHEESLSHISNVGVWKNSQQQDATRGSVMQQLSTAYQTQVELNRRNLRKIFEVIFLMGRQNIPLRGHDESKDSHNRGNLLEFLEYLSRYCPDLKRHLEGNFHYVSPKSQNDMLKLIASNIQKRITTAVKHCGFFGLICDESQDISRVEQMSVNVRFVTDSLNVEERFLGFWPLKGTDGESLFQQLTQVLLETGLSMSMVRAQCYDGASSMCGKHSGLATRLQEVEKKAGYVHCHAHRLNLSLQNSCENVTDVRNVLGAVSSLYNLLEGSAKRHEKFQDVQRRQNEGKGPQAVLQRPCHTRWGSRHAAVHTVRQQFASILIALDELSDDAAIGSEAHCLLTVVSSFNFLFYVSVLDTLLGLISHLSQYLQGENVDLQAAKRSADSVIATLQSFRTNESFENFWQSSEKESKAKNLAPPALLRARRPSHRIDERSTTQYQPLSPKERYRQAYYELLDIMVSDLTRRFCSKDYRVFCGIEKLLSESVSLSAPDQSLVSEILHFYTGDFDNTQFTSEIRVFYNYSKLHFSKDVVETGNIGALARQFVSLRCTELFPQVFKLFKLFLCIPATSSTAERSFSALRRLKSWLRTRMADERLRSLALMCFECDIAKELESNIDDLVSQFGALCDRRLPLQ